MKKTVISILAAMALMASAYAVPQAFALQGGGAASDPSQMGTGSFSSSYDLNQLIGKDVKGSQGNLIGTVKDVVLDPNGHVFAVINDQQTGKTVAVPTEAFSSIGQGNELTLNLSQDQLASAPQFDRAFMANPDWSQQLYRQYGIQPSYSEPGMAGSQHGQMGGPSSQFPEQQQGSQYGGRSGSRSY